jgi:hypothetical protein
MGRRHRFMLAPGSCCSAQDATLHSRHTLALAIRSAANSPWRWKPPAVSADCAADVPAFQVLWVEDAAIAHGQAYEDLKVIRATERYLGQQQS